MRRLTNRLRPLRAPRVRPRARAGVLALALALGVVSQASGCALSRLDHLLQQVPASAARRFDAGRFNAGRGTYAAHGAAGRSSPRIDLRRVIDLPHCIQVALERRPETRVTWLALRAAAAGAGRARAAYMPSLDLSALGTVGDPLEPVTPQSRGVSHLLQVGLGLHYLLFDGGARVAGLSVARAVLTGAGLQHNATILGVVRAVEQAYYVLLSAEQQERVARESVRQTRAHVALAQARRQADVALRLDVLQAETALAQARLARVRAHGLVRLARGRLAHAMGLSPAVAIQAAQVGVPDPEQALGRIRALLREALARRPELGAARARVRKARAAVNAARARYWPAISIGAQAGVQLRRDSTQYTSWSGGLGVTIPIFDGLDREYAIRQARLEAERSAAEVVGLARDIEQQVWTAYAAMKEAVEAIRAAMALVQRATESVRTAEAQYRLGTATIVDLVDAESAGTQARLRLVQARLAWHAGLAELRWAVGRLDGRRAPAPGGRRPTRAARRPGL